MVESWLDSTPRPWSRLQLQVSPGADARVPPHTACGRGSIAFVRAAGAVCQGCPAFRACTSAKEIGRSLAIGPHGEAPRRHRAWTSTSVAKEAHRLRKQLVEPVFGINKEQQSARRFLLRGLANVAAEWVLLATTFNLRTLWRVWSASPSFSHLFHGPKACLVS